MRVPSGTRANKVGPDTRAVAAVLAEIIGGRKIAAVGRAAGIDRTMLSRMLDGLKSINFDELMALCRALDISPRALVQASDLVKAEIIDVRAAADWVLTDRPPDRPTDRPTEAQPTVGPKTLEDQQQRGAQPDGDRSLELRAAIFRHAVLGTAPPDQVVMDESDNDTPERPSRPA